MLKRFDLIEAALARHAYLMGESFTVADAYLFTVFSWMSTLAIDLADWPNIVDYVERIAKRPSVIAARAREAEIPPVA